MVRIPDSSRTSRKVGEVPNGGFLHHSNWLHSITWSARALTVGGAVRQSPASLNALGFFTDDDAVNA